MKDLIDKFGFGLIQDSVNVIKYMKKRGVVTGAEEVLVSMVDDYIAEGRGVGRCCGEGKSSPVRYRCNSKSCDGTLVIRAIDGENKHNYKSHWFRAKNCGYEKYSKNEVELEMKTEIKRRKLRR